MRICSDVEKVVQELAESIRAKTWVELEPKESPTLLSHWFEDLENYSGRIPVHGPIVISEKKVTSKNP